MSCSNPDMEKLINLYQFGFLSDDQKLKVEAHLLECEACLKELYRMSPTLELLNNNPELFLDTLKSRKTFFAKLSSLIKKPFKFIHKMISQLFSLISFRWNRPAIKIAVPVVLTACVLFIIFSQLPKQYSDLAILEKSPYESLRFMGPEDLSPAEEIFKSALEYYGNDNYTEAISQLHAFLSHEPENPYAHFYLGVSFHLINQLDSSLKHLEMSSLLSQQMDDHALLEKSYWHLGNVYLKINNEEKALQTFSVLIALHGSFEGDAQKQIDRIIRMKNSRSRD